MPKAFREVRRRKRQVAIELYQKVPVRRHLGKTAVKRLHHAAASGPIAPITLMENSHPSVLSSICVQDLSGAVGRAVVHHDPLIWSNRLGSHRSNRALNVMTLIPNWTDYDIAHIIHTIIFSNKQYLEKTLTTFPKASTLKVS
jgi:hypothetical protein